MKKIVYIDLDGVVADFVAYYESYYNVSISNVEKLANNKTKFAKDEFFKNLPIINDGVNIIGYLEKIEGVEIRILTAVGDNDLEINRKHKEEWVRENLGDYPFYWVKKAADKAIYASPDAYLVDDRPKSLDPYLNAGGAGYLYNNDSIDAINDCLIWLNK